MIDALLLLSRAPPGREAVGLLSDALDVLLAGASSARGAAFVVAGDALDLVAGRGLTPGLRAALGRLPLSDPSWFVAQRAARSRRLVIDRVIAPHDRAAFAEARWEQTVACPVVAGTTLLGVVVIAWPDVEQPDEQVLAAIEIGCHMTALELLRIGHAPAPQEDAPARASGLACAPPREPLLPPEQEERTSDSPESLRQERLSALALAAADSLRRDGPTRGAALIAMLRARGASEQDALAVLTFALSTGAVVRGTPPSIIFRASDAGEPRTVLVVDDDDDLRQTLSEILNDEGYAVETATNGLEALDVLRLHGAPRVLVLDLMMPVMDGWQLLEALRRDEALCRIPVIIISARSRGPGAAGASEILAKPLDYYKLVTSVERSVCRVAGAA